MEEQFPPHPSDEHASKVKMQSLGEGFTRTLCWYVDHPGAEPSAGVIHNENSPIVRKVIIWEWLGDKWCGPMWVDYFRVFPYHPSGDGRPFPELPMTPDEEEKARHRQAMEAYRRNVRNARRPPQISVSIPPGETPETIGAAVRSALETVKPTYFAAGDEEQ